MSRGALILFAGLTAVASAQRNLVTFTDTSRSLTLKFRDIAQATLPGPVYHVELSNPGDKVYVSSKSQGIELFAPRIVVDAVALFGKEMNYVRTATATGGVRAIQSSPSGRSEITGTEAKYHSGGGDATLTMSGPVRMTDYGQREQSFVATGSSLVANLSSAGKNRRLRTATLAGPVTIKIKRAAQAGQGAADVSLSAQKLVYDQGSGPGTITLSGKVKANGLFSGGILEGSFSRIVLTLNDRGEVVKASGSGG